METYSCPMHPEVEQKLPGNCPQCGMKLVVSNNQNTKPQAFGSKVQNKKDPKLHQYLPLIIIISLITLTALVVTFRKQPSLFSFIHSFMTGFFLIFSGFKLIDLKGFAEGYSTYDLLAKRFRFYAYFYPFLELIFGLLMLAGLNFSGLFLVEGIVMIFSGLGVAQKLAHKEKIHCACLGTILKIPLTYVTLLEDFGMALFAFMLILIS